MPMKRMTKIFSSMKKKKYHKVKIIWKPCLAWWMAFLTMEDEAARLSLNNEFLCLIEFVSNCHVKKRFLPVFVEFRVVFSHSSFQQLWWSLKNYLPNNPSRLHNSSFKLLHKGWTQLLQVVDFFYFSFTWKKSKNCCLVPGAEQQVLLNIKLQNDISCCAGVWNCTTPVWSRISVEVASILDVK